LNLEERVTKYQARQEAEFNMWIYEAVNTICPIGEVDENCNPALFPQLTAYLSHYSRARVWDGVCEPLIDVINNASLSETHSLAEYKAYLQTPEAQLVISGETKVVNSFYYTIFSVDRIKALCKQYRFVSREFMSIPSRAKKQKMAGVE
jgi:hypothetical protein